MMKRILLTLALLLLPVNGQKEDACQERTFDRSVVMNFKGIPENLTPIHKRLLEDAFQTTYNRLGEDLCGEGSLRHLDDVKIVEQPQERRLLSVRRRAFTFAPFSLNFGFRFKCRGCPFGAGLFGDDASRRSLAQGTSGSSQERSLKVSHCAPCEMITHELFINNYNNVLQEIAQEAGVSFAGVIQLAESVSELKESLSHSVCEHFAVHAGTSVTFDGVLTTIHGGDVGAGVQITGNCLLEHGGQEFLKSNFAASVISAHGAAIAVQDHEHALIGGEIGDMTFTPGTYRFTSGLSIGTGTVVTLDGNYEPNPVFLFISGSTLITATGTSFILKNGATADNILWALGTAATLGSYSVLEGNILAGTAITVGKLAKLNGCALAKSGVAFESEGSIKKEN